MTQPFFPCTISAQSRNNEFLTIKTVVRKTHQNNGHTRSSCLDKAVLAQGGGGMFHLPSKSPVCPSYGTKCAERPENGPKTRTHNKFALMALMANSRTHIPTYLHLTLLLFVPSI